MQAMVFRAHVRKARRAPDFGAALFDATRVGADAYDVDMGLDGLDEAELLELAGGEAFAQWWQGLDEYAQIRFARGEAPPWRETL